MAEVNTGPHKAPEAPSSTIDADVDKQISGLMEGLNKGGAQPVDKEAADKAEGDLEEKGPDAALEDLAEGDGSADDKKAESEDSHNDEASRPDSAGDNAGGGNTATQENPQQPESMDQRVAELQEQVTRLTEQNLQLTEDMQKLTEGLKTFLEKAEAEEQDQNKKTKFRDLLLILAAVGVETVVQGGQKITSQQ